MSSGSDRLRNAINREANRLDNQGAQPRFALVTSVDPATHSARVTYQPEGTLSGWLPMGAQQAGSGIGMVAPYQPGDQVVVMPTQGSIEHGVIMCAVYSDNERPPQTPTALNGQGGNSPVEAGGLAIVHSSGATIRITPGGDILLIPKGKVLLQGDMHCTGTVTADTDVIAGGNAVSLVNHKHTAQGATSITSKPN